MADWQLIETVPEGKHVLLFWKDGELGVGGIECATIYKNNSFGFSFWTHGGPNGGSDWETDEMPTHWMPLPEAPKLSS